MLGTEKIKTALLSVILLGMELDKALKDKKITLLEGIGMIPEIKDVYLALKNWDDIIDEYDDLDEEELVEINSFFATELDITNDRVEVIIESAFELLIAISEFRQKLTRR